VLKHWSLFFRSVSDEEKKFNNIDPQHNFVHRDIRETSIYLESSGRVRLGDFSIDKRIRDLVSGSKEGEEKFPVAIGRSVKKSIYAVDRAVAVAGVSDLKR